MVAAEGLGLGEGDGRAVVADGDGVVVRSDDAPAARDGDGIVGPEQPAASNATETANEIKTRIGSSSSACGVAGETSCRAVWFR
jgi:hypothetical protein